VPGAAGESAPPDLGGLTPGDNPLALYAPPPPTLPHSNVLRK